MKRPTKPGPHLGKGVFASVGRGYKIGERIQRTRVFPKNSGAALTPASNEKIGLVLERRLKKKKP